MIVKTNPEFGVELALTMPYVYSLHKQGKLDTVITSKGMKPFYYFCDDVEEKYDFRTIDNLAAGLGSLPNSWIYGNKKNAEFFLNSVNRSIAMHNVSTQFADGGEFGFGGEIGISTNKLPPRGPVGINQLTSYKYLVTGKGIVRP